MQEDASQHDLHDALVNAARLAHLELDDERREAMVADVSRILEHIEKMGAMDLDGVDPLLHPLDGVGTLSADEPGEALPTEALMEIAPVTHPPYVKVPKVIDGGEA